MRGQLRPTLFWLRFRSSTTLRLMWIRLCLTGLVRALAARSLLSWSPGLVLLRFWVFRPRWPRLWALGLALVAFTPRRLRAFASSVTVALLALNWRRQFRHSRMFWLWLSMLTRPTVLWATVSSCSTQLLCLICERSQTLTGILCGIR